MISNEDVDLEYFKQGQEGYYFGPPASQSAEEPKAMATAPTEVANPAATPADNAALSKDKGTEELSITQPKLIFCTRSRN